MPGLPQAPVGMGLYSENQKLKGKKAGVDKDLKCLLPVKVGIGSIIKSQLFLNKDNGG